MRDLVIAIPSKGRPFASAFRLVEKVKCPVWVYVHAPEYRLYKENLPEHFEIKTHNENWIGDIRRLIQKEHAEKNNAVLIMDDDISAVYGEDRIYQKSMTEVIENISGRIGEAEILLLMARTRGGKQLRETPIDDWDRVINICYVLNHEVYKKGVTFTDNPYLSEDTDFTAQVLHKGITFMQMPYWVIFACGNEGSNFGTDWYSISMANMYAKWGHHVKLSFDYSNPLAHGYLLPKNIREFTGPVYTAEGNEAIRKTIEFHAQTQNRQELLEQYKIVWEKVKNGPFVEGDIVNAQ